MSTQILAVQNFAQQMGMMGSGNAQPEVTVQVSFGPGAILSLSPQMMMQQQSQVDSQPKGPLPTSMMQQQSQLAAQSELLRPTEEHAMPCDFTKRPGPLKLQLIHKHAAGAAQRTAEHEQRV